jgi:hypothetical protein
MQTHTPGDGALCSAHGTAVGQRLRRPTVTGKVVCVSALLKKYTMVLPLLSGATSKLLAPPAKLNNNICHLSFFMQAIAFVNSIHC